MKVNLNGEVALVTGAARGIGKAIAGLLAENGGRVIVADIDLAAAEATAGGIAGARPLRMDVTDPAVVAAGIGEISREFGRLDILVNNAGLNTVAHRVTIEQFPLEEWDRIVNVDLRGVFIVSKEGVKVMAAQGGGRIVNIASVLGVVPARLQCAYNAAKAGVVNLTQSMALELAGRGIRVNGVAPGSTITDATRELFYGQGAAMGDRAKQLLSHVPMGRAGEAREIAQAVLFFAAPESSYITGQVLCVDGGWSAGGFLRDF
jgi:3-oxoacyl-[acyl-carrier protein] reductase